MLLCAYLYAITFIFYSLYITNIKLQALIKIKIYSKVQIWNIYILSFHRLILHCKILVSNSTSLSYRRLYCFKQFNSSPKWIVNVWIMKSFFPDIDLLYPSHIFYFSLHCGAAAAASKGFDKVPWFELICKLDATQSSRDWFGTPWMSPLGCSGQTFPTHPA